MQWESAVRNYGSARQPPELMHYGIKGQKWGLRRFQEENGSYTEAGKKRYGKSSGTTGGLKKRNTKGTVKRSRRDWKPEDAENLSDEELNKRNSRMQREQQYRDATTPKWKKEVKQTAKDWTKEAVKRIFIGTAVTLAVVAVSAQYKKAQNYIGHQANRKIASLKAAKMLKSAVEKKRYFDNRGPEILGKHVGRR